MVTDEDAPTMNDLWGAEMTAPTADDRPAAIQVDPELKAKPAVTVELVPHPKAMMLPDLPQKKYQALKASIATNGQQRPILILKGANCIVDGRHRYRAARELGKQPWIEVIDLAEEEVAFYIAADVLKRDGVTTTQKVVIAVDLLPELEKRAAKRQHLGAKVREGEEKGKASDAAGKAVGVGSRYVESGLKLQRQHPDLFERVRSGELSLPAAQRVAKGKETKPKPSPKCKECQGGRFLVPERLRERLAAVGGANLGEGVEALLNFIEREGRDAWERQARAPSETDHREDSAQVMAA